MRTMWGPSTAPAFVQKPRAGRPFSWQTCPPPPPADLGPIFRASRPTISMAPSKRDLSCDGPKLGGGGGREASRRNAIVVSHIGDGANTNVQGVSLGHHDWENTHQSMRRPKPADCSRPGIGQIRLGQSRPRLAEFTPELAGVAHSVSERRHTTAETVGVKSGWSLRAALARMLPQCNRSDALSGSSSAKVGPNLFDVGPNSVAAKHSWSNAAQIWSTPSNFDHQSWCNSANTWSSSAQLGRCRSKSAESAASR